MGHIPPGSKIKIIIPSYYQEYQLYHIFLQVYYLKLSTKKLSKETIKNITKRLDRLTTSWDATRSMVGVTELVQPKGVTRKVLVNHNYTVKPLYSRHP
jgi:hypothetical protein